MHIVIFAISFCEYIILQANALAARGHRVLIVMPTSLIENTVAQDFQGLLQSGVSAYTYDGNQRTSLNFYRDLFAAIRLFDPHIIHIHENGELETLAFLLLFDRIPKALTIHDVTPHPGRDSQAVLRRKLIRKLASLRTDMVHVHSNGLRQKLAAFRPYLSQKASVIPHGTLSLFQYWATCDITPEPHTCLFFGRMEKYRGLDNLLKIGDRLKEALPTIKIIIAGRGMELTRYRSELEHLGIFEIMDVFIPDSEIHALFRRASLLLLPYHEASQSGVISMGLPFGVPVVATAVGAIPEVITDGIHGSLVKPGDTSAFADAILNLLTDETTLSRMREDCLDLARVYDFTNLAPSYEQLYQEAIQRKQS